MTGLEFGIIVLWIVLPPLLLGSLLLWRFMRGVAPQITFLLLFLLVAAATFIFAPGSLGRYLGVHDIHIMGRTLLLSPIGFVSAFISWPLAALLSVRPKH